MISDLRSELHKLEVQRLAPRWRMLADAGSKEVQGTGTVVALSLNVTEFCQADSERLTISMKKEAKHFSMMERRIPWPTGSVLRFINAG